MSDFQDTNVMHNRRGSDPVIEMIAHKVSSMERSMDKLTEAITKLAVIEEKQASDRAALERAFMAIQKTDERYAAMCDKMTDRFTASDARIDSLEAAAPMNSLTTNWVMTAVWAVVACAAVYIAKKLGLM